MRRTIKITKFSSCSLLLLASAAAYLLASLKQCWIWLLNSLPIRYLRLLVTELNNTFWMELNNTFWTRSTATYESSSISKLETPMLAANLKPSCKANISAAVLVVWPRNRNLFLQTINSRSQSPRTYALDLFLDFRLHWALPWSRVYYGFVFFSRKSYSTSFSCDGSKVDPATIGLWCYKCNLRSAC